MSALPRPFGPYLLLARLGKGGSGSAYVARVRDRAPTTTDGVRPIVVKILHRRLRKYDEFVKRFRHEAEMAVRVSSPHVVRVLDAGRVGQQPYIAMDYVRGWTLSRINARMAETDVLLAIPLALEVIAQVLQGLIALHEAIDAEGRPMSAIHRDLAPKNLIVGDDGRVRLIDLGLGKSRAQDWKTDTGAVMGSPGYMAPEQIAGRGVDQRTDLYAAGVVLHELLTGHRYVMPGRPVEMLRRAVSKRFEPPSARRRDVPPEIDTLVQQAMATRRERRFETARAFMAAVQDCLPKRPGSMALQRLVDELLGSAKHARDVELGRLMSLPDPDAPEPDVFTEVYVRHPERAVSPVRPGPNESALRTRLSATQSWTPDPSRASPSAAVPMAGVPARSGFRGWWTAVVGAAVVLGFGTAVATIMLADSARVRTAARPEGPLRAADTAPSSVDPPPSAPVEVQAAPLAEPQISGREGPDKEDRRRASRSRRPKKRRAAKPKKRRVAPESSRRGTAAPPEPASGPTAASDPATEATARIDRLRRQITGRLKAIEDTDPRREAWSRLLGRLSMAQMMDPAQAGPQLDVLEREASTLLKDTADTPADPR